MPNLYEVKNWIKSMRLNALFFLAFVSAITMIFAVWGSRVLYADGVFWLYCLSQGCEIHIDIPERSHGIFLLYMLPILLVKIGITNYKWLSWAYTLNSYGLPLFFWFLALFGARKDRNIFFVVAACFGMCFFSAATLLFNPHILNYSLAAAVFVLLLRNKPINTLDALIVLLLICLQLKTYESVIFLTPLQLLFLLTRLYYDRPDRITKSILYMCLFVGLYVTYYGVASFFSSAFDATKKSAFLPLSLLLQSPNLRLTVCMLLFLFSSSLSGLVFRNARKLKFVNIVMSLLMITACLCFFASHNWGYEKPWLLVDLRIPAGYVLFTVFAALFFDRLVLQSRFLKGLALGKSWPFAVLVFCITVAWQDIRFSVGYKDYLDKFYATVNTPPVKIMHINETAIPKRFSWAWTNEIQSVVLADTYPCSIVLSDMVVANKFNPCGNTDKTRPRIISMSPYFAKGFTWSEKEN